MLTTDSSNTMVGFCAKRISDETDTAAKHLQQNSPYRRFTMFGYVRRLCESAPAHEALRLAVDTRAGG